MAPVETRAVAPFACDAFIFSEHSPTSVVICGLAGHNSQTYLRLAGSWCGGDG